MVGVRGSLEQDISSLRALGLGGGQISRVVHVSTRAAFGVLREIRVLGVIPHAPGAGIAIKSCMRVP